MATLNKNEKRDVIPNWRSYEKTIDLGELSSSSKEQFILPKIDISDYVEAWNENKNMAFAGDLISAAIMCNQTLMSEVQAAAHFVVANSECASKVLYDISSGILDVETNVSKKSPIDVLSKLSKIENNESVFKERIRFLKKANIKYPYNAINYCEIARCYANLGLIDKAKDMMKIAVHLAKSSRYISRAAARLFVHTGDKDIAHKIIVSNPFIHTDPWLLASEIAINSSMDRTSRYIKIGKEIIDSDNYSAFSFSELASAVGSIEFFNGNNKKCRIYTNKSLIQPNDNSLAQADWIISENKNMSLDFGDYSYLKYRSEADTRWAYLNDDYEKALAKSIDWMRDFPFDTTPIFFASNLAYTHLQDFEIAEKIINIGLRANSGNPALLNNLAYTKAMNNDCLEAERILNMPQLNSVALSNEVKVCLIATRGLVEFRKGNTDVGRLLYIKAMNDAVEYGCDKTVVDKAKLNFIREEIKATSDFDKGILDDFGMLNTGDDKETLRMKRDILDLLHSRN